MKLHAAIVCLALIAVMTSVGCTRSSRLEQSGLNVSVAASLQNVMQELASTYQQSHPGTQLRFNFGGSGTLAQQIEQGVPADVFLSAAPKPMDTLMGKGLVLTATRHDLLRNQIVLIAPKESVRPVSFKELADSQIKLIALGDPASVPVGDYGRQTLVALHLWEKVQTKLVLAKDVRQVLSYVETGNADAGIVYATDARESHNVRVATVAPAGTHADVVYPVAVLKDTQDAPAAQAFVQFLMSLQARDIFTRHGFLPISP